MRNAKLLALAVLIASMAMLIPKPAAAMFCDDWTPQPSCQSCMSKCLYTSACTGYRCQSMGGGEYTCTCTIIPPP